MKLCEFLKMKRVENDLKMREVVVHTGIAQSILSKLESGERFPTEAQMESLSKCYQVAVSEMRKIWLAEKIYQLSHSYPEALEAMQVAESRVEYLRSDRVLAQLDLSDKIRKALEGLTDKQIVWNEKRPLDQTQLEKMEEYFRIEYTYDSNRIEGNTLTYQETALVVNEGLTIGGKPMKDHLEAINHSEAAEFVVDLVGDGLDLNKRTLLQLHSLVLRGIDRNNAGRYRSVPVMISGSTHVPPQPFLLDKLMEDYFIHYENQKNILHPVILAAEMHERLVSIHPFVDGNGRTSRLVMNLILLSRGYTITSLKGDDDSRLEYYRSLEEVQADANPERFYQLIIGACERSLDAHIHLAG